MADDESCSSATGKRGAVIPSPSDGSSLHAAIHDEREMLTEVINSADLIIDTSRTSIYELGDMPFASASTAAARKNPVRTDRVIRLQERDPGGRRFRIRPALPAQSLLGTLSCAVLPAWTPESSNFSTNRSQRCRHARRHPRSFLERWIPEVPEGKPQLPDCRDRLHRRTASLGLHGGETRRFTRCERVTISSGLVTTNSRAA